VYVIVIKDQNRKSWVRNLYFVGILFLKMIESRENISWFFTSSKNLYATILLINLHFQPHCKCIQTCLVEQTSCCVTKEILQQQYKRLDFIAKNID